jgi:hypothetical protein
MMEGVVNGKEVEFRPVRELGFDGDDSWKGVEGCVEAVLSAMLGLFASAFPDVSRKLWRRSENEAEFCCT